MNVAIVIVLSSIFNLLSCAPLERIRNRAATALPTPPTEFLSSSTGTQTCFFFLLFYKHSLFYFTLKAIFNGVSFAKSDIYCPEWIAAICL